MSDYISLKELARELGTDKSNCRRYVIRQGFTFVQMRLPDSGQQLALALSSTDAAAVRALRNSQGFGDIASPVEITSGWFYLVQVVPDLGPQRIKLGFTGDVERRLQEHRCVSPTACLVRCWPCERVWEDAAMASATRAGCRLIGNEVYDCDDLAQIVTQADDFFAIMPHR